jgi:Nitrile hydratase beta subunit
MTPDPELSSLARRHARGQRQNAGVVPEQPFHEPWQARAFALAVTTVDQLGLPWDAFRDHLKAAVADQPQRPYWESWLTALEIMTTQHVDAVG